MCPLTVAPLGEEMHIPRNDLKPYLVYVQVEENCVSFNSSSLGEEIHIPRNGLKPFLVSVKVEENCFL